MGKKRQGNRKLETFFNNLIDDDVFRNRGDIASAVDMTDSGFSRAVMDEGTLSIETCIKLADYLGREPGPILRLADRGNGRAKIADLLEAAYGKGARFNVTREEKELLKSWRKMKPVPKAAVTSLIHNMGGQTARVQRARSSGAATSGRTTDRKGRFHASA